ncbi:peptidoglycan-associated lipoprotein [Polynucleobacter sp. SHI8]|uniref:peptidoglycan-associated lipoprotein Pal n=1 Tax=unclassified Polynucleobacter TaxID=2640945 RepID=UPI002491CA74|nr:MULTISPECIES: peptidoglycan-associated lipoprotein Pal [unclassified Polynucleobacter]BDW10246.1 peptidoglycan-associated lipoprotein [Polynucleobacter sp. SHI2]BDW12692.1 peptidoglycan-associated lipoprotein [Polynucleobacter sp. SHI8]
MFKHLFNRRTSLAVLTLITLGLGACSSGVKLDDVEAAKKTGSGSTDSKYANEPWNDPASPIYQKSFYFDFDSYTVKSSDQSLINSHAQFLNSNKSQKIVIQGNTDDSGTTEYNLALGQKRSDAVRKLLSLLGVSESQMEAVSFGKEKPKSTSPDDSGRAENRRADIVYIK